MPALPDSSPQTLAVYAALRRRADQWHYGYDIGRETGLASGTLYPILARLADRGLLETHWEQDPPEGRPRRHLYRLTAAGAAMTAALPAAAGAKVAAQGVPPDGRRRPAVEGTWWREERSGC